MPDLHGATVLRDDPPGRTTLANETVVLAFMLLGFHRAGAPVTNYLLWWARKILAQNGEMTPEQVEGLAP